ncbi:DNA methyltransferase [uncultured Flavonifractor sp.]|uniref:site-specific DNA-methyltransferase (adenine-specific) n=1 Tax=Candidatus Flavonifractor intestinigallinarum TaxID=2838586 RepID=A0A9D2SC97_9FIRM|nr:DNA methyltransferase [uncultured Flavonifractor sp.]HJB80975.1 methylase [Candidatus Flavonifractor intestinigallinarum]
MTDVQQRAAAKEFTAYWAGRGDEKQETQRFWIDLLRNVYGVEEPEKAIEFECPVKLDHVSFIDGYIKDTRVLIEQKGADIDLRRGYKQSDGSMLTPYQQARRYAGYLPHDKNPRWIVVCNFREFHVHDMNRPNDEPEVVALADLEKEYHRLNFLVDTGDENIKKEMEISLQAGEIVGTLYDALLKQYKDPESPETLKSLNALCVRLVFCLYAEDAEIFGGHGKFHDYMQRHQSDARRALMDLFQVLDTRPEDRDPYMDDDLASFPYVNGGLFADEHIIIPRLDETIVELILQRASADFDWSSISPTIFGAVFESTLNPETRRSGGMHYTSIENIHKVIDPLFLEDLKGELAEIQAVAVETTRKRRLKEFQHKLAGLKFLDPACGSGNFLTETYISLRKLENEALRSLSNQITMGDFTNPIEVSIGQFYGIEINDFAVTVAKTALWIAESQMMKETEDIIHMSLDFLPLKSYANIVEGNALRMDWESVVPKHELDYIMGNPPFVGGMMMTREQHDELAQAFPNCKKVGEIDYVAGWYAKATKLIQGTSIRCAFVSTNSICQGQSVASVWEPLFAEHIHIDFAHRTFRWDSEAKLKARVHCVIVGFSVASNKKKKMLFTSERPMEVSNINGYLLDAENVFIENRSIPLCDVPKMRFGSMPRDGGGFILNKEEKCALIEKEPISQKWIHLYIGAEEFINNKKRYCLWLVDAAPNELRSCKEVLRRVETVRTFRANSKAAATRKFAETPTLFCQIAQPDTDYIIIPGVSSEKRRYVPIGFMDKDTIASNLVQIIPDATLYHFGVLTSNVHMAWMRAVCGRLKSDYRYSKDIVYNNFPWPTPTDEQRAKIEETAQAILDARALYPDSSLADLYDETTMPPELRKAHQQNDKAVMRAYGFDIKTTTETTCVAELMKLYQKLTEATGK